VRGIRSGFGFTTLCVALSHAASKVLALSRNHLHQTPLAAVPKLSWSAFLARHPAAHRIHAVKAALAARGIVGGGQSCLDRRSP
jgi:hypothetical protein